MSIVSLRFGQVTNASTKPKAKKTPKHTENPSEEKPKGRESVGETTKLPPGVVKEITHP